MPCVLLLDVVTHLCLFARDTVVQPAPPVPGGAHAGCDVRADLGSPGLRAAWLLGSRVSTLVSLSCQPLPSQSQRDGRAVGPSSGWRLMSQGSPNLARINTVPGVLAQY